MRSGVCGDCHRSFTVDSRSGAFPRRCDDCKREYVRTYSREYQRATRPPRKQAVCTDCGVVLPTPIGRGRPRLRCDQCLDAWTRADNRRRMNAWLQDPANRIRSRAIGKISHAKTGAARRPTKVDNYYRYKYKITRVERDRMLAEQNGLCKICGKPPRPSHRGGCLQVDHCHSTGVVRSLLCGNCNTMLGLAGEDPQVLLAAIQYLAEHKAATTAVDEPNGGASIA